MAAEALEKTVSNTKGLEIKVEQQGAMGIINKIEQNEVNAADVVIIAADKNVDEMNRFKNKKILNIGVSKPIKDPKKVLQDAINLANN